MVNFHGLCKLASCIMSLNVVQESIDLLDFCKIMQDVKKSLINTNIKKWR